MSFIRSEGNSVPYLLEVGDCDVQSGGKIYLTKIKGCGIYWVLSEKVPTSPIPLPMAVDELGYRGDDVARSLRISGRGVSDCRERGRKILDKPEIIGEYLA